MATAPVTAPEFCSLLSKSRLVSADDTEALYRKWKDDTRSPDDQVDGFVKFLTGRKVLTPWQAALIQRGRADGFFLDQYKILEQLGKGQMGGVYKAVHALGQLVALKILPASRAKDARVLGRFQREARLLTQLDHPNVVRAYQVGESGGRHYIVMEFLEGETLDEVLARRKRLPVAEAVRLVRQALDGLQHLHDRRTVHRDLKPANLMIVPAGGKGGADTTADATLKILDIGLGRELFHEDAPEGLIETQLTVEGAVVGTPDYMAPEQAKDARSSDIRADIYSLGCVLYHLLTGRPPFPDGNIMTQMLRHATESPTPLAEVLGDVPAGLQAVLDKLTAKKPEERYQTPAEGAAALDRFQNPGAAGGPARAEVAPAFDQWLRAEAQAEAARPAPVKAGSGSLPPLQPQPRPASPAGAPKPGTAPAPAYQPGGRTGPAPAPPPPPAYPAPAYPAPAPAYPAPPPGVPPYGAPYPAPPGMGAPAPYPYPAPASAPAPVPQPWPPAAGRPSQMPMPLGDEVDVELVTLPPAVQSPAALLPLDDAPTRFAPPPPDDRSLLEINRRDLMMLVMGGAGVVGAVSAGYGLARLVRALKAAPPEETTEEKKE